LKRKRYRHKLCGRECTVSLLGRRDSLPGPRPAEQFTNALPCLFLGEGHRLAPFAHPAADHLLKPHPGAPLCQAHV
jgi:hypothetical protein